MQSVIRVENLSKQYRLGARPAGYRTLRESLNDTAKAVWKKFSRNGMARDSEPAKEKGSFWALKDVSFEIKRGEVVGIVGRNGAGKSTLLKILSRIVEPTSGRARVRGRMGSLLEVGTGFHPELTGRENIYLNGSILGMTRKEITRKFDEIVAFSEIEQFLETPVKRYSSGMYVRLAFAVAAHLDPEILTVDEVLAVGDAAFQKKCLDKMSEANYTGKTVLLVSHNMVAMKSLCTRGILLRNGKLVQLGSIQEVADTYQKDGVADTSGFNRSRRLVTTDRCSIVDCWLAKEGSRTDVLEWNKPFELHIEIEVVAPTKLSTQFLVRDQDHVPLMFSAADPDRVTVHQLEPGRHVVTSRCDGVKLAGGNYYIDLAAMVAIPHKSYDAYECALRFSTEGFPGSPGGWQFHQSARLGTVGLDVVTAVTRNGDPGSPIVNG